MNLLKFKLWYITSDSFVFCFGDNTASIGLIYNYFNRNILETLHFKSDPLFESDNKILNRIEKI